MDDGGVVCDGGKQEIGQVLGGSADSGQRAENTERYTLYAENLL